MRNRWRGFSATGILFVSRKWLNDANAMKAGMFICVAADRTPGAP